MILTKFGALSHQSSEHDRKARKQHVVTVQGKHDKSYASGVVDPVNQNNRDAD